MCYAVLNTGAVEVVLAVRSWVCVCCLAQQLSAWCFSSSSGVYVFPFPSAGLYCIFFLSCLLSPRRFLFSLVSRLRLLFCCGLEASFWLMGCRQLRICSRIVCLVLCCLILYTVKVFHAVQVSGAVKVVLAVRS